MLPALPSVALTSAAGPLMTSPVLAQAGGEGPRGYTLSVAIVMACVLLGLIVALRPSKRDPEVKRPKLD